MDNERIVKLLEEILKWTRFEGVLRVKEVLLDTLEKDEEKLTYEYSDGRDSREIARIAGVSHQTVVNYWKKWAIIGIVEPLKVRGGIRYKRSFSLLDFGIELPKVKAKVISEEPADVGKEYG